MASLLPANADHAKVLHALGIQGDPLESRRKILQSRRTGIRFEGEAYSYARAFKYCPTEEDREWLRESTALGALTDAVMLDPTAGGGSMPLEAARLGLTTIGNDLNPVAVLIQKATVQWPMQLGQPLLTEFRNLAERFIAKRDERLKAFFPQEPEPSAVPTNYVWARTICCPYCNGLVPLSPNWRLAPDGTGVKLLPQCGEGPGKPNRLCHFQIVKTPPEQSQGTVADGDGKCPFPDCGRVIPGDEIKSQAHAGRMGDQLYAVVFKRPVRTQTKTGKSREKWLRGYRSARPEDDNSAAIATRLAEKMPEWEALDTIPSEQLPRETETWTHGNTPAQYGATTFRDLFSPRQFLCHATAAEIWHELLAEAQSTQPLSDIKRAAFAYLALTMDRFIDYNSRQVTWHSGREVMDHTFRQHAFPNKWSYAEMPPLIQGVGYDWTVEQTAKCIEELIEMVRPDGDREHPTSTPTLFSNGWTPPPINITCKPGDALDHLAPSSVDCIVMDPPYYDNVMYAELSDFFYVWLKRNVGLLFPELFRRPLTDKEEEAVANIARFRDKKGAKVLAGRHYQERMAAIFAECYRVLKPNGIMTLMFTHKATGAWDALTKGLMQAGFTITASWPVNTEAEGSLHIKDKAAANSTIFLACRPRLIQPAGNETRYWEDVEPLVAQAVRHRVAEFQQSGIRGVDLYLASFGPALQKFSEFWPLTRGTPKPRPASRRAVQKELWEEEWDPYAVSPEDALDAARREVKRWRLEQLTHKRASTELDARTAWFVLAWDAFQAPVFPYDEGLRLARAVGVDLDQQIVGSLSEKKGSDLLIWDSAQRAAKSALGPADGSNGMIDALHHAAHQARSKTLEAGRELLERSGVLADQDFIPALQAILEVLPVGTAFSGLELPADVAGAGNDFEALEKLRRLAFADRVESPKQLELWQGGNGAGSPTLPA
jgi:adenine-specific DNA methylase